MITGYNTHRLREDDPYYKDEVRAVELVNEKYLKYNRDFLGQVLGRQDNPYVNEEEEKAILSVIQWLGTPVGKSFINDLYNTNI